MSSEYVVPRVRPGAEYLTMHVLCLIEPHGEYDRDSRTNALADRDRMVKPMNSR